MTAFIISPFSQIRRCEKLGPGPPGAHPGSCSRIRRGLTGARDQHRVGAVQVRKDLLEARHLRPVVDDDVEIVWMTGQVILVVSLRRKEVLPGLHASHDGCIEYS